MEPKIDFSIASLIQEVRGQKIILDSDLAMLFDVETKRLNEQVKRNSNRFPEDLAFKLTSDEFDHLKSHFATSSTKSHGGRRNLPYAFTEHGAIMAASVLNSEKAVAMSLYVVRAFVRMRRIITENSELTVKLEELESKVNLHDDAIRAIITAIKDMIEPARSSIKKIGFVSGEKKP